MERDGLLSRRSRPTDLAPNPGQHQLPAPCKHLTDVSLSLVHLPPLQAETCGHAHRNLCPSTNVALYWMPLGTAGLLALIHLTPSSYITQREALILQAPQLTSPLQAQETYHFSLVYSAIDEVMPRVQELWQIARLDDTKVGREQAHQRIAQVIKVSGSHLKFVITMPVPPNLILVQVSTSAYLHVKKTQQIIALKQQARMSGAHCHPNSHRLSRITPTIASHSSSRK